jgi:serine/threonine protein kinase/TolB-like protein
LIGRTISQYRIQERLGSGGMGEVYLAHDLRLGRKVALKVLLAEQACRATFLERFRREARAAAALQHPNIVTIYSVEEAEGIPFLTMELVEGSTLADLIPSDGMPPMPPMPLDRMLRIAIQLADALSAAHEHGIVHRDIKPRNLMITADERLKVLDFGIAKRVFAEDLPTLVAGEPTEELTREGQILGTVSYMSPEQLQGLPLDPRSDLFSVGVVLYQMATGHLPFRGRTPTEQMIAMLEQPVSLPGVVRAGLPRRFDEIVARCLERDPRQRYQSARVLHDDLEALRREPVSSSRLTTRPELPPARRRSFEKWTGGAAVALLLLVTCMGFMMRRQPAVPVPPVPPVAAGAHALAVLPLENLSKGPEYFVDGMTDALIASLGNVGRVRVISRQSVMRFKGSDEALPAIARQLGVDLVLTGSVVRSGQEVRITISLVQADPEQQLWAETYERPLKDILALQDDVTREVAGQVRMELTEQERSRLSDARPVDPEAYDLYLQGRDSWERRTREGLEKAIGYFGQAIAKDPGYAAAHAGLADAWALLGYFRYAPPELAFGRARAESIRALELDPDLAEAHASLGYVLFFHNWNGPAAEKELRRALELNPSYASVHHWLWAYLSSAGRLEEAGRHLRIAKQLNPLSPSVNVAMATQFLILRDFDRAIEQCRKSIEMEPGYGLAYEHLWGALDRKGRDAEAFEAFGHALSLYGYMEVARQSESVYARSGYRAALVAAAGILALEPDPEKAPVSLIATTFALAGEKDKALAWLERGVDRREPFVLWLRQHVEWDGLRDDPRFQQLAERVDRQRSAQTP